MPENQSSNQTPNQPLRPRENAVKELLEQLLPLVGVEADVSVETSGEVIQANLTGDDISLLIGGRGRTLNALQCLVNVAVNRPGEDWERIVLDAEGYRERRQESLTRLAAKTAERAVGEGEAVKLEPMNSFERRLVHCALADRTDVRTTSEGEEPYRYVVIAPAETEQDRDDRDPETDSEEI